MNWSEQFRRREEVREKYRHLWDLRIIRNRVSFSFGYLKDGESILEIGAYHREFESKVKKEFPRILYKSMDIDPSSPHDYSSFGEIKETFDVVLLFEVIEHLPLKEGREMVAQIFKLLNPGGRVILTTPNVCTPGQFWKDATHITPYSYEEFGGLFLSQHFSILEMGRISRESLFKFVLKRYIFLFIFRFLGIDFSQSIILVAEKG